MKSKIKKISKRAISALLSLLIILSVFPTTVFASTFITDMNSDAKFGVISGTLDKYGHEMHYSTYDGKTYIVFCVQYGKTSPDGSTYKYGKDFVKYVNRSGDTYRKIADYIAFGYTLQYGDGLPNTKEEWIAACCTQQYVWETLGVNPTRSSWNSTYMSDSLYKKWKADTDALIELYYDKQISFNGDTKKINLGGSTTLTDSNGVLKYYPSFTKTIDKVTFKHTQGENKLNISVASDCTTHSVKFNSATQKIYKDLPDGTSYDENTTNYVYFDFDSGSVQNLMFSKQVDPQNFKVDINVEFGNLKISKSSEDEIIKNITFTVTGNGKTYTLTTDNNGNAELKNIPVGTYTIKEEDIVRYVKQATKTADVTNNHTTNVSFNNKLKKFRVQVTKTDVEKTAPQGDGTLAGASYGLYKGSTLIDTYYTDKFGQFTTDYYVCDTDWTIKELSSSEGYLVDGKTHPVGADPKLYKLEYNECKNAVTEMPIKGKIAIIKHTDDGSTQIETPEKGAEFQVYLKSAGSYDNADPDERDTLVCDEYGYAVTKLLPYGKYVVHQTKGWDGREFIKDFTVYVSENGKTYPYLINNANFESYLKVVKKDTETGKTIPYANAGFQIYDNHNNLISMTYTYPAPTTIDTFYTNDEGYLVTPEKLPYAKGYKLVEVAAPYGYVVDKTPIVFDITAENATIENALTIVKVEKENTAQKGTISVIKLGEVFFDVSVSGNEEETQIYQPVFAKDTLKGAVYEIIAAEDIITPDGTTRAKKGDVVDTITTNDKGVATSKLLYLSQYNVREKVAPYGMVLSDEIHSVELVYAGQNVEISKTSTSFYNERQKAEIKFEKTMELDELFGIGNNSEVTSVTFGLYAAKELVSANGEKIPADALLEIITMDKNGKAEVKTDLPIGEYYVQEIATNNAYILNDNKYPVLFEYAGQEKAVVNLTVNNGEPIVNKPKYGSVSGIKKDENGSNLGGALIGIFKADTTEYTKENALKTAVSADDGSFSFDNIPYGTWYIREIAPPTAFVLNDTLFEVTVTDNEQVIEIEIVNNFIRGNISLTKVDKDYPDNKLTGAEFEVFEDTNGNGKYDKDDKSIGKLNEDEIGIYTMKNLMYGQYFVKEIKAPENFLLDENVYSVFIDTDAKTYNVENEAGVGFVNAAMTGSLKIVKTSSDKKVEGFSFRVTGANGYDKVFKTDKNGEILIENLRVGEYKVSEVSDRVSAGYILAEDKTAVVKTDSTTVVKMHNTLKDTPKTGDNSNNRTIATVMGVSALGIVSLAYYLIKKKKSNKGGKSE